jgi:hypothetical protein
MEDFKKINVVQIGVFGIDKLVLKKCLDGSQVLRLKSEEELFTTLHWDKAGLFNWIQMLIHVSNRN